MLGGLQPETVLAPMVLLAGGRVSARHGESLIDLRRHQAAPPAARRPALAPNQVSLAALKQLAAFPQPPAGLPADVLLVHLQLVRRPGAVPGRDGRRPRHVRVDQRRAWRHQLPRVAGPGPACRDRDADRLLRSTFPSWAASSGSVSTTRCSRPASSESYRPRQSRGSPSGCCCFDGVRAGHGPVRRRRAAVDLSNPRGILTGLAFAGPSRHSRLRSQRERVQRGLPLRDHPDVPVLGTFFPIDHCRRPPGGRVADPLYHGVALSRGLSSATPPRSRW